METRILRWNLNRLWIRIDTSSCHSSVSWIRIFSNVYDKRERHTVDNFFIHLYIWHGSIKCILPRCLCTTSFHGLLALSTQVNFLLIQTKFCLKALFFRKEKFIYPGFSSSLDLISIYRAFHILEIGLSYYLHTFLGFFSPACLALIIGFLFTAIRLRHVLNTFLNLNFISTAFASTAYIYFNCQLYNKVLARSEEVRKERLALMRGKEVRKRVKSCQPLGFKLGGIQRITPSAFPICVDVILANLTNLLILYSAEG